MYTHVQAAHCIHSKIYENRAINDCSTGAGIYHPENARDFAAKREPGQRGRKFQTLISRLLSQTL